MEGMRYWLSFWRDVLLVRTDSGTAITNIDIEDTINQTSEAVTEKEAERAVSALEHAFRRVQIANLRLMLDVILMDWPTVRVR
jgi:hypothetical protein